MLIHSSCLTLCNPVGYSLPSSFVHGILQQKSWSALPFPSPGDLPDPGIKPMSPMSSSLADRFLTTAPPGKPLSNMIYIQFLVQFLVSNLIHCVFFT